MRLSNDQATVLDILRAATHPLSPADVAGAMGAQRTPAGAAKSLMALYDRGLATRAYGERCALFAAAALNTGAVGTW